MNILGWLPCQKRERAVPLVHFYDSDFENGYSSSADNIYITSETWRNFIPLVKEKKLYKVSEYISSVPKGTLPKGSEEEYPNEYHFDELFTGKIIGPSGSTNLSMARDILNAEWFFDNDGNVFAGLSDPYIEELTNTTYYVIPASTMYETVINPISFTAGSVVGLDRYVIFALFPNSYGPVLTFLGSNGYITNKFVYRIGSENTKYTIYDSYEEAVEKSGNYANNNPYNPGGTSGVGGGGGNFGVGVPNDNVSIDIPSGSNFGYVGGSMFTHYALSGNQVEHFGEWLWTDNLGLSLWKTAMEKIFNETADALIGLMAFPFNISTLPNVSLVDGTIKAGNLPTGIPARILGSPYTQVDWGTIQLTEYWGNFLDYAPHTKIELYLPWSTGFVPIDPHQVMPDPITKLPVSLSVKTNIDLQKGTCTHNVSAGNTVIGVYEGQVGYEIPLLSSNFSAKLAGATVAAVSTLVTAGAAAGIGASISASNAIGMARTAASNAAWKSALSQHISPMPGEYGPMPMTNEAIAFAQRKLTSFTPKEVPSYSQIASGTPMKLATASSSATAKQPVNVSRNGSFSGSSAGMSIQYPYVIISRPEQNIPSGYGNYYGYPSNVGVVNMLQLKGYTEIGAIHLNGIRALPDEIAELDDILKGGFII